MVAQVIDSAGGSSLAPFTFGLAALPAVFSSIGAGRKAADAWNRNVGDKFLSEVLGPATDKANAGDPVGAAQDVATAWQGLMKTAYLFTHGDGSPVSKLVNFASNQKVIDQMLKTPSLIETVSGLLAPLGKHALDPIFQSDTPWNAGAQQPTAEPPAPVADPQAAVPAQDIAPPQNLGFQDETPPLSPEQGVTGQITPSMISMLGPILDILRGGGGSAPYPWENPAQPVPVPPEGVTAAPEEAVPTEQTGTTEDDLQRSIPDTGPITVNVPKPAGKSPLEIFGDIFGIKPGGNLASQLIGLGIPLTSAILQGLSTSKAANTQADAANRSADLEAKASSDALDFAKTIYGDEKTANAPFLSASTSALAEIQKLIGPGGAASADFTAPTAEEVRGTPGYQMQLDEAYKAIKRSGGGVINGAQIKAAEKWGADYADTKYDEATDRALNIFQTNRQNKLGPQFTLAGYGPQAVNTGNQAGQNITGTNTDLTRGTAEDIGNLGQQAAFARSSGYGQGVLSQVLATLLARQKTQQARGI